MEEHQPMRSNFDETLCAENIAKELHCCKAHAHKIMNGEVQGCTKLPVIRLGRKKIVRRSSFERWKEENDR